MNNKENRKDDVYEVDAIMAKRIVNGKIQFLVKWKNYPESANTWEREANIFNSELIAEFESREHQKRKRKMAESIATEPITKRPRNQEAGSDSNPNVDIIEIKGRLTNIEDLLQSLVVEVKRVNAAAPGSSGPPAPPPPPPLPMSLLKPNRLQSVGKTPQHDRMLDELKHVLSQSSKPSQVKRNLVKDGKEVTKANSLPYDQKKLKHVEEFQTVKLKPSNRSHHKK